MHSADELIECKTVLAGNKQITIKASYIRSFLKEAAMQDRRPVLSVEVDGLHLVLLTEADYVELRENVNE
jgi:hypothetical protein